MTADDPNGTPAQPDEQRPTVDQTSPDDRDADERAEVTLHSAGEDEEAPWCVAVMTAH